MGIIDLLFPKICLGCGAGGVYICDDCLTKVQKIMPFCPVCEKASIDGMTHAKCKTKLSLDGLTSLWRYEGVIRKSVLNLKYRFAYDIANELSIRCVENLNEIYHLSHATLVPIPLHKSRQKWRGFNQSEKVGELVARQMGWDFAPELLIRKESRKSQTELDRDERKENVKGVFSLNPSYQLHATSYLLFDDVWTTGSTMKEACKVLKRNGAKSVWGLTIAS